MDRGILLSERVCSVLIVCVMFKSCDQHCETTEKHRGVMAAKRKGGSPVGGPRGPIMF